MYIKKFSIIPELFRRILFFAPHLSKNRINSTLSGEPFPAVDDGHSAPRYTDGEPIGQFINRYVTSTSVKNAVDKTFQCMMCGHHTRDMFNQVRKFCKILLQQLSKSCYLYFPLRRST